MEIKHIFLCAVFILGLNGLFTPGNIFQSFASRLSKLPVNAQKPLFRCAFCMSSVWGTLWYWALVPKTPEINAWFYWPVFCILVAGSVRLFMLIGNYDVMEMK
jgi:hypothetical protein